MCGFWLESSELSEERSDEDSEEILKEKSDEPHITIPIGHGLDKGTPEEGKDSKDKESEIDEVSVMTEVTDDPEGEPEKKEISNLMGWTIQHWVNKGKRMG